MANPEVSFHQSPTAYTCNLWDQLNEKVDNRVVKFTITTLKTSLSVVMLGLFEIAVRTPIALAAKALQTITPNKFSWVNNKTQALISHFNFTRNAMTQSIKDLFCTRNVKLEKALAAKADHTKEVLKDASKVPAVQSEASAPIEQPKKQKAETVVVEEAPAPAKQAKVAEFSELIKSTESKTSSYFNRKTAMFVAVTAVAVGALALLGTVYSSNPIILGNPSCAVSYFNPTILGNVASYVTPFFGTLCPAYEFFDLPPFNQTAYDLKYRPAKIELIDPIPMVSIKTLMTGLVAVGAAVALPARQAALGF